jgi:alkanesulfonate monooxygenase SsuD/methylene tetrahydromethanopterin reductase-like flavin-dependent oxidoreductase (luciferase family)
MDWESLDDDLRAMVAARLVIGDPDTAGEQVRRFIDVGLDGVTFNMPANGHDPEAVARSVGVVKAAVG